MRPEDYPPQEPFGAASAAYHAAVMALGRDVADGIEWRYGADACQSIALHPSARPGGAVLLFIHGGGWTNGYKEWMRFMAPAFNAAGVTFATSGYRLAPANVFPAGLDDCAEAVLSLRGRVAGHGGDPDRLFVGGHSAGGHYAALLATRDDWWRRRGLAANPIRGALPVSGVYRFGDGSGLTNRPRFLGAGDHEAAASPIVGMADDTPFLMAHGERDFPHLMRQAAEMEAAVGARGVPCERIVLADADHFEASYSTGRSDSVWFPRALRFMGVTAGNT